MINSLYLVIFGQVHTRTHFASFASHVYSASRAITTTNKEGEWKKVHNLRLFFFRISTLQKKWKKVHNLQLFFLRISTLQIFAGWHSQHNSPLHIEWRDRELNLQIPKERKRLNDCRKKETFYNTCLSLKTTLSVVILNAFLLISVWPLLQHPACYFNRQISGLCLQM